MWDPAQFPHLPHLMALEAGSMFGAGVFKVSEFSVECTSIRHAGTQAILLTEAGRSVQLNVHGADLEKPVHLFADAVAPSILRSERALVLGVVSDLRTLGRFRAARFPPEPRGARLSVILQALDGHLAGAAHRDIAIEIFGASRVATTWRDPRNHLRDAVRRAISRGRMLMNGGYRKFVSGV